MIINPQKRKQMIESRLESLERQLIEFELDKVQAEARGKTKDVEIATQRMSDVNKAYNALIALLK